VTIGGGTLGNSLIHMLDGLGSGGQLKITAAILPPDDDGDILIGSPIGTEAPVTFDGCIDITGDRNSDITVRGCHATSDELDICISGTMSGEINIEQSGCENQVEPNCLGGCQ
jgi:hypothetical protein